MATITNPFLIDPSKNAKYTVTMSEQLLRDDAPRKRQRVSVQLNSKPKSSSPALRSTIKPSHSGAQNSYNLLIEHGGNGVRYEYDGNQQPATSMALVYDPKNQSFSLEKTDAVFRFNLRGTSSSTDAASLAAERPQLQTEDPDNEHNSNDLFEDVFDNEVGGEEATPDPSNPYDYRHFLKSANSPSPPSERSVASSPASKYNSQPSPVNRPSHSSSRPKQRDRYLSPTPRQSVDADHEEADFGGLVIDMGDSAMTNSKPWRSALGVLNEGGRSSGPISLRSAASSMSPSLRGESEDEKENSDQEEQSNADVEDIDLGNGEIEMADEDEAANGNGWEDDDLEAELEQALESQADDRNEAPINGSHTRVVEQSSSESEEE